MKFTSQVLFLSESQILLSDPITFILPPSASQKSKPHVFWAHSRPFWLMGNHFFPFFDFGDLKMKAEQKDNLCHSPQHLKTHMCLSSN